MLNALRLKEGFELSLFTERTGLPLQRIDAAVETAMQRGLLLRDGERLAPTALGFDFLSDLQQIFLGR